MFKLLAAALVGSLMAMSAECMKIKDAGHLQEDFSEHSEGTSMKLKKNG